MKRILKKEGGIEIYWDWLITVNHTFIRLTEVLRHQGKKKIMCFQLIIVHCTIYFRNGKLELGGTWEPWQLR